MSFFVIIILIANVYVSRKGFRKISFFQKYVLKIEAFQQGEYYRLISSSFLHVDTNHLLFNMLTLFFFGDYVVSYFGGLLFWFIYLASVLSGSLYGVYYNRDKSHYTAAGASGGVVGVLFSALLAFPEMKLGFLFFPIPIPGYLFVILYLAYTVYGMKSQQDHIGHSAHLGGAIGGVLTSLIISPGLLSQWFGQVPI